MAVKDYLNGESPVKIIQIKAAVFLVGFILLTTSLLLLRDTFIKSQKLEHTSDSKQGNNEEVLGLDTQVPNFVFNVNVPAFFYDSAEFKGAVKVEGKLVAEEVEADNLIYSLTASDGISVSSGQTPSIKNIGVISLQDKTGKLSLTAGTDISISGLTINNSSTLSTVRGRGGCTDCITDADIVGGLTISGGTVDNTPIGATTANTGAFTTLSASGATTLSSTLAVTGATTLSGALSIAGATTFTGTISSDFIPTTASTYSLGSSAKPWSALYLTGAATLGGQTTFTSSPTGTGVGNGSIYINPASVSDSSYTLFGIAVGGTEKLRMDANGNITVQGNLLGPTGGSIGYWTRSGTTLYPYTSGDSIITTGNLGVGLTAPVARFHLLGTSTSTGVSFLTQNSTQTNFGLSVLDNGNVGVGTTGPATKLEVNRGATAGDILRLQGGSSQSTYTWGIDNNNSLALETNWLVVKNTGNVGIGTISPSYKFDVQGTSGSVLINTNGHIMAGAYRIGGAQILDNPSGNILRLGAHSTWDTLRFDTSGTEKVRINSSGNVGVNTNAPLSKLGVLGNLALGATYGALAAPTSGLLVEGNVGVGTTSPLANLHVVGQCVAQGTRIRRRRRRRKTMDDGEIEDGNLKMEDGKIDQNNLSSTINPRDTTFNLLPSTVSDYIYEDIPVEEIKPGDEVLSLNDQTGKWEWHKVEATLDKGIQTVYRLETESGKYIETTSEHPYLVKIENSHQKTALADGFNVPVVGKPTIVCQTVPIRYHEISKLSSDNKKHLRGPDGIRTRTDCLTHSGSAINLPAQNTEASLLSQTITKWVKVSQLKSGMEIATSEGWEKVANITKTGRKQTYDLQIEGTHNFVGNNIVAHNTILRGLGTTTGLNFRVQDSGGADKFSILDNGNVGIGTTGPGAKLDLSSSSVTGPDFRITNTGVVTGTVASIVADSLTSGTALDISVDALNSGKGLNLATTTTTAFSGSLANIDWSPTGSTNIYATGDLLTLSVGNQYGFAGNLLNIKDNGSSVFSVSQTAVTTSLPANFTSPGDVSIAYDLNFTNPQASYIKSSAPLYLTAGANFNSSDLTLGTYNNGQIVLDTPGGVTLNQYQPWTLNNSSTMAWNIINSSGTTLMSFDTTNGNVGIGRSGPYGKLSVFGAGSTTGITFSTQGTTTQGLAVLDNGNVGIGTTAPLQKLDLVTGSSYGIAGTSVLSGTTLGTGVLTSSLTTVGALASGSIASGFGTISTGNTITTTGTIGTAATTTFTGAGATFSGNVLFGGSTGILASGGNVGVGTTSPLANLHVVGQCVTGDTLLKRRRRRKTRKNSDDQNTGESDDLTIRNSDTSGSLSPSEFSENDYEDIRIDQIQPGDEILTLNEKTGEFVTSKIKALQNKGKQEVFELVTESGKSIQTTSEHPYLTLSGWKKVSQLKEGTSIATRQDTPQAVFAFVDETGISTGDPHQKEMGVGVLTLHGTNRDLFEFNRKLRKVLISAIDILNKQDAQFEFKFKSVTKRSLPLQKKLLKIMSEHRSLWSFSWEFQPHGQDVWDMYLNSTRKIFDNLQGKFTVLLDFLDKPRRSTRTLVEIEQLSSVANTLQVESQGTIFLQVADIILGGLAYTRSKRRDIVKRKLSEEVLGLILGNKKATADPVCVASSDENIPQKKGFVKFEKVISIKSKGRKQTFDIEVEGTHNFVGNNIVAHNTILQGLGTTTGLNFRVQDSGGADKFTILDNGNVGIGTTGPAYKLDISETSSASIRIGTNINLAAGYTGSDITAGLLSANYAKSTGFAFNTTSAATPEVNAGVYGISREGGVGVYQAGLAGFAYEAANAIGVVGRGSLNSTAGTAYGVLGYGHVNGTQTAYGGWFGLAITNGGTQNSNSTALVADNMVSTGRIFEARDNGTAVLSIIDGGNVGIGTISPLAKLGVLGNLALGATYGALAAPTSGLLVEGNVGIGTTSPFGQFQVGSGVTPGLFVNSGNVGVGTTGPVSLLDINKLFNVFSSGLVGIGTTTPLNLLSVSGGNVAIVDNTQSIGTGADGACSITDGTITLDAASSNSCSGRSTADAVSYNITTSISAGATTINVGATPTGIAANDEILIINLRGTSTDYSNVGKYETVVVTSVSSNTLNLDRQIKNTYDGTTQKIMVQRVPNYTTVTIGDNTGAAGSAVLTVGAYDNTTGKGGVIFFRATGAVTVNSDGKVDGSGKGYAGGNGNTNGNPGYGGNTYNGSGGNGAAYATNGYAGQGGGGGGGWSTTNSGAAGTIGGGGGGGGANTASGGGGGYGVVGNGGSGGYNGSAGSGTTGGNAGTTGPGNGGGGGSYGSTDLSNLFFGSGGGGGAGCTSSPGGSGGNGGGIIFIGALNVTVNGSISANGNNGGDSGGTNGSGGGGGAAGGSVHLKSSTLALGASLVTTTSGSGGTGISGGCGTGGNGGNGGTGRIRLDYNTSTGTTSPSVGYTGNFTQTDASLFINRTSSYGDLLGLQYNGVNRLRVDSFGNVGIGVSVNPVGLLQVGSNVTPGLFVNSSGNVGIGTTGPTNPLSVVGNANITGNVGIGTSVTSNPLTVGIDGSTGNGAYLSAGGTWTNGSSFEFKENFTSLDTLEILNKINLLNISSWNYKLEPGVTHIGPVAEEFYSVFGVGNDSKHISTIDPSGIALAGIKELTSRIMILEDKIASLSARIATPSAEVEPLSLTPPEVLLATQSAQIKELTTVSDATISGQLKAYEAVIQETFKSLGKTFLGNTIIAGGLTVDGTMSITSDSINSVDTLFLQNSLLSKGLDILNGLFVFDSEGNLTVSGKVLAEQFAVKKGQTSGVGKISSGDTKVAVVNKFATQDSLILLTPHRPILQSLAVTNKNIGSFSAQLVKPEEFDLEFDYLIIGQE